MYLIYFALWKGLTVKSTEKFLDKHKFCPKTAHSAVQPWCKKEKEKCKCLFSNTCILLDTMWTTCFRTNLWKIWVGFIS